MPAPTRAAAGALALALLAGCATTDLGTPGDPLERMNRATHRFNDSVDRAVLRPVARGYRDHVPQLIRTGVDNFLGNLAFPTTIVNDLLQLKVKDTLVDLGRFAVNTTLGLAGILDPATRFGIPKNDEDFGQTLGRWGVPPGPYVVLPFLGPSTLRDGPALYVDSQTDLRVALDLEQEVKWALAGLSLVNQRAGLLAFDPSVDAAYDRYAFVRNAWLQRREYQVRDGAVDDGIPLEELEELEALEALEALEDPEGASAGEAPDGREAEPGAEPAPEDGPPAQPPPGGASSSATSPMPASEATDAGTLR